MLANFRMKSSEFIILLYLVAFHFNLAAGQHGIPPRNASQLICIPFGTCEPCPEDALKQPFCQPFGNRRLMHCTPSDTHGDRPPSPALQGDMHVGEIPAWESCGRIVEKERGDFFEFVACTFGLALLAIGMVLVRSKQLKAMQARQLAARIGLVRSVPGGWVNG